jgi:MFS family permease
VSDEDAPPLEQPLPGVEGIPREVWVLVAAAFVIALGYGIIAPALPQFAASFDVGIMASAGIVTAFSAMRLVFAPAGGQLIQRFGERWVYLVGVLIVAVSTGAVAYAGSYWQLIVFRGLGGIGSVMFTVSAMGLLVRLAPPSKRGRVSALYASAFLLGNIGGPILGSALVPLGYRLIFGLYAGALLVAVAVVFVFLPETPEPLATDGTPHPVMRFREAFAHPAYRAAMASSFANGWTNFGGRVALLPLMAAALPSLGAALAGVALTLFALGSAVIQQLTGRLVDARGRRPMVVIGLVVCGLATLGFGWATTPVWFLALSLLAGGGAAFLGPAQQAAVADVLGRDRRGGSALSAISMVTDIGSIGGTVIAGLVADLAGFGWSFALSGAVMLAAVVPWLRSPETGVVRV